MEDVLLTKLCNGRKKLKCERGLRYRLQMRKQNKDHRQKAHSLKREILNNNNN